MTPEEELIALAIALKLERGAGRWLYDCDKTMLRYVLENGRIVNSYDPRKYPDVSLFGRYSTPQQVKR